jgi:RHS repeat-associated protein
VPPACESAPKGPFDGVFRSAGPPHISIDPNGNLTSKTEGNDTWTYEWDAENQLTRVLKNGVEQARYAYDPIGRRVERVAGGNTTGWTYDGVNVVRQITGSTTAKYIHGPATDEPLAQEDGAGALTYFHTDALGSVIRTTGSAGAVLTTRQYDALGKLELDATSGYAFTGREWDSAVGLYYYRARYYDPKIGRFVSEDPIGFKGGGPNFYSYVRNNPVNATDPTGLAECCTDCPSQEWYLDGGLTFGIGAGLGYSASFGNLVCKQRPWVRRPVIVRCTMAGPFVNAGVGGDFQLPWPSNPSISGICRLNPTGPPVPMRSWYFGLGGFSASKGSNPSTWNFAASLGPSAGVAHQTCYVYPD